MKTLLCTLALGLGTATAAMAADTAETLTLDYATFEAAVPHVDLEACPEALAQDDRFCRATLAGEQLHVFAFSYDGDSPLVGFRSFDAAALPGLLD